MIACPVALGIAARLAGMPYDWVVALVIAYCAPPSSGTSTIARMLSLDASVALVATLASMVFVPLTAPLLTVWFSHDAAVSISPLMLAWRLALLIGSAEGVALLVRRFAGSRLDRYATPIDATVVVALLVFALGTMAGMQQSIIDAPHRALTAIALAFAVNAGFQVIAYGATPGDVRTRLNVALIVANRNVGLMWAALGSPRRPPWRSCSPARSCRSTRCRASSSICCRASKLSACAAVHASRHAMPFPFRLRSRIQHDATHRDRRPRHRQQPRARAWRSRGKWP